MKLCKDKCSTCHKYLTCSLRPVLTESEIKSMVKGTEANSK